MIFSLLTFFVAHAYPQQTYTADISSYETSGKKWGNKPSIYLCNKSGIDIEYVKTAKNFWNDQKTSTKIDKIIPTYDCNINNLPLYSILINNSQININRQEHYGYEITSFFNYNNNIIAKSHIEINTDMPEHVIKITIAHELGHSLGYKHCLNCKKTDIMQIE